MVLIFYVTGAHVERLSICEIEDFGVLQRIWIKKKKTEFVRLWDFLFSKMFSTVMFLSMCDLGINKKGCDFIVICLCVRLIRSQLCWIVLCPKIAGVVAMSAIPAFWRLK